MMVGTVVVMLGTVVVIFESGGESRPAMNTWDTDVLGDAVIVVMAIVLVGVVVVTHCSYSAGDCVYVNDFEDTLAL